MRRIIISCLFVTALSTMLFGGETEIEVIQGKVRGRTPQTEMVISAGQKGLVKEGQKPIVAVNDPLVQETVQLYRWVEEERKSGRSIENASIWAAALDEEQVLRTANLVEYTHDGSEAKSVIQVGPMSTYKDLRIYDFDGNLLDYEVKPNSEHSTTYSIHLPNPIEPGEKIRYITVSPSLERIFWLSEGPVWSLVSNSSGSSKGKLFLYKIILPESAILLGTYPEVLITDKVEDRIALTFRRFIEDSRNSTLAISFLWPDKDGTSLEDIPPEMRGLEDPQQARIIQEGRKQMARIMDGQRFADESTPMNVLLSGVSILIHDLDKAAILGAADHPFIKIVFKGDLERAIETFAEYKTSVVNDVDIHSCSLPPAEPKQGDTAWIKFKFKGTFKSVATAEFVYMGGGRWVFQGGDFY